MKSDNLTAIARFHENLFNKINTLKMEEIAENRTDIIESIDTLDDIKTIIVTKGNKTYRMNSIYHPVYEADTWVEHCDLKDIRKVISVFGLGNGLYIRNLLRKLDGNDIIIIYEPCIDIFMHVIENYDIVDIVHDHRVHIIIEGINELQFRRILETNVSWMNLQSQRKYALPQYEAMFEDSYKSFIKTIIANNDNAVMIQNTDGLFGKVVVENSFTNMKYLQNGNLLDDYIGAFPEDIPAIIVSAGPSLDKNIEELKRVNKRAVIFVVDRALEYIYKHNIEPDYAVTIDPLKPLQYFGKGYEVKVPLFTELHSNKNILDAHKGKKIFYDAFQYIDTLIQDTNKQITLGYPIGKSVATAAFTICIKLGFKRIILMGQDLAYSDEGNATHAGGINTETDSYGEIYVEGVNGNRVKTRMDWYDFLLWFGDMIEQNPEIDFIDATEGGAKIRGTRVMQLSEVIDQYLVRQFDVKELNESLKPSFTKDDLKIIDSEIENSLKELSAIKRKAKEAKEACEKLIRFCNYNQSLDRNSEKLAKKIIKVNEYICVRPIYAFINSYIADATRESMSDIFAMSDDDNDLRVTFEKGKDMYEQVILAAQGIKDIIKTCYNNNNE